MSEINIFYADDDDDDLMFFNDAVVAISKKAEKAITLHIHKNGEYLLDGIKKNRINNSVVFLDLNMPRKSGFQFLEEIRSEPEIKEIPVIIYSTSSDDENILLSHNLGANFYAVKPYNFNDLIKMIINVAEINWQEHKADYDNFLFNKIVN
ncbi:response regulator [Flavobacterium sp. J27]|uniref:response regulator n=1 Tax=Flavobacterium sp. J27 TaxID=2060419 RepID=UPI0010327747|nr:response regulator [Flavobacterium sp. J27]